jgi:hypothetical protein
MGWPLILALAGQAAQAESENNAQNVAREYQEEKALKEQEARNRALDQMARTSEQKATASYLKGTSPAGVGGIDVSAEEVDVPSLLLSNLLSGAGGAATQIGNYYAPLYNQEKYKYSGSKTPLKDVDINMPENEDIFYA